MKSTSPRKPPPSKEPSNLPEYVVRKEVLMRYFKPSISDSTFYELVNKGVIVPFKHLRGYFKLNESLRRMGLKEVPHLPEEMPPRSVEEIIRMAFHLMEPDVFPAPTWMLFTEQITEAEASVARDCIERHQAALKDCESDALKQVYLQGVLDVEYMEKMVRQGLLD